MPIPDSPRRIAVAVGVALVLTAAAVPAVAALLSWAFPAPEKRFSARVACDEQGKPSRTCRLGQLPRAHFLDHRESKTPYTRCVRKPNGGTYCEQLKTAVLPDSPVEEPLNIDGTGRWEVSWLVDGRVVGRWSFRVEPPVGSAG